ncbi:bromodomain-containing protein DDB_G0280777-like [Drosophila subpulchrella]|uniref:bromodomain-containing protein DDB_G0280777-like n=1 Tax=Drosophila subpulchrella TaxID=1486046 RepID=UPI0018A16223|nr:bromodomain-containing protein DDB_G0280777-like [Drosophila subpulchrella]
MDRGESCPLPCTNRSSENTKKSPVKVENSLLALFGFSSEQDDLYRTRNLRSDDTLGLVVSKWLRYSLEDMSLRQPFVPTTMGQYQQQQLLQKRPQLQRHNPMSLPQEHPLISQQQQQLQQQQLQQQQLQLQQQRQQQQYYYAQLQPQIGTVYNPRPWLPYQNQQPSNQRGNYQYWYGMPPRSVNIQQAVPLHPELIPPSFCQHPNGAYIQPSAAPKPENKAAMKARNPPPKDQAQPTVLQGRPMAGGRSNFRPQSSTESGSLNRINSLTSFQDESGFRVRDSKEDMIKYRRIAARTLSPDMEEFERRQKNLKLQKEKPSQESKLKEEENDSSLGSGASSLFRRLAQFMRSRSLRKSKKMSAKSKNQDEVSQKSSVFSAPKKRGFLRRFFGEVRDHEVDTCEQQQEKSVCDVHYPTDLPINNQDQEDVREADYFRRLRKRQQRRKLEDIYRIPAEH